MARARLTTFGDDPRSYLQWHCPGCATRHMVPVHHGKPVPTLWGWDGSLTTPSLEPSVKVTWTEGEAHTPRVCHTLIKAGAIQFLGDSTHALANHTVPMLEIT